MKPATMKHFLLSLFLLIAAGKTFAQCSAGFTFTSNANVFSFTDTSTTVNGSVIGWAWNFGDFSGSTQQNPQHTYEVCGYYEVSLTIFTSSFCSNTFTDTVLVNSGFSGAFTFTVDTTDGTVQFQAQPFSTALDYSWDFGDTTTGTGPAPTHQYDSTGTYNVCVVLSDTAGICSDTVCMPVYVYIAPPSCNATFNNQLLSAGLEMFTAAPFNQDWNYSWDFGDSNTGNGFIVTNQYMTSGTYTVCLMVNDSTTGCSSLFCDTVNVVIPTTCEPSFTSTGINGTYGFLAAPFDIQNTYSWDFGDNSPAATGTATTHTYTVSGTYNVCLTMTTPTGCTDTYCEMITVVIIGVEESAGILPLSVYPNPAAEKLSLDYSLQRASAVSTELLDLAGRSLMRVSSEKAAGAQHAELDVQSLAAGTYIVRVTTAEGTGNYMFVKE
jgi:large repetitive protein